uniref:Uncharacterized protein n=1 Tax=Chlorocebus sabaeus TaxID=60711 RepID=A0A0D9R275_CHLSB
MPLKASFCSRTAQRANQNTGNHERAPALSLCESQGCFEDEKEVFSPVPCVETSDELLPMCSGPGDSWGDPIAWLGRNNLSPGTSAWKVPRWIRVVGEDWLSAGPADCVFINDLTT